MTNYLTFLLNFTLTILLCLFVSAYCVAIPDVYATLISTMFGLSQLHVAKLRNKEYNITMENNKLKAELNEIRTWVE